MNRLKDNLLVRSRTSSVSSINSSSSRSTTTVNDRNGSMAAIKVKLFNCDETNSVEINLDNPSNGHSSNGAINNGAEANGHQEPCPTTLELKHAEDVVIKLCQQLKIKPLSRYLFALYNPNYKVWLAANQIMLEWTESRNFELRIRFKPASLDYLRVTIN